MLSKIKDLFEEHLSEKKILDDYSNYVTKANLITIEEGIEVYDFNSEKYNLVHLRLEDKVTIVSYSFSFEYDMGYTINVKITVGNFIRDKEAIGMSIVEKCFAKMRYNDDLELFDIEFYNGLS